MGLINRRDGPDRVTTDEYRLEPLAHVGNIGNHEVHVTPSYEHALLGVPQLRSSRDIDTEKFGRTDAGQYNGNPFVVG